MILKAIRAGGGCETNFDARPWPDETHLRRAGHHSQRLTPSAIARSVLQKRSSSYDKERGQLVTTRRYTVTIDKYTRYMQQPCNLQTIRRRPRRGDFRFWAQFIRKSVKSPRHAVPL